MLTPIDFLPNIPRPGWPSAPLATSLKKLAALAPELRELRVFDPRIASDLAGIVDKLRDLFPQRRRSADATGRSLDASLVAGRDHARRFLIDLSGFVAEIYKQS